MAGTKKKTRAKSKKRAKKPKVVLSAKKVVIMCACVCCFCAAFLALSVVLNSVPEKEPENQKIATAKPVEEISVPEQKKSAQAADVSNSSQKTASVSQSKNQVPSQKSAQTKKTSVQKSEPAKSSAQKSSVQKSNSAQKSEPAESSSQKSAQPQKSSSQKTSTTSNANQKKSVQTASQNQKKSAQTANTNEKKTAQAATANQNKPAQVASVNSNQNQNTQEQALKNPRFDIPKAAKNATVVIVIDDAGRSVENVKKYAALPFPLTIAVLPKLPQSRECAQASIKLGKEVILHQPMQSINHKLDPGPGKITVDMSFAEISSILNANLDSLGPGVKGMNNHEGSEVTGDVIRIGAVLDVCKSRGIYFLDSRTTAATKAPQAALERDMKIYEKAGPYIDNDLTREKMLERMYETLRYANNHGHAIVIGHVDKSVNILPDLLSEMYPYMKAAGYRFATPSTLR